MVPVGVIATILASPKVKEAIDGLTKDAVDSGKHALIRWLKPTHRDRAARKAIEIFSMEWNAELEGTPFTMAFEGYRDQFQKLVEVAAPEIAELMVPEARSVDLSFLESLWGSLLLDTLPPDFSWERVAQNYSRAINKQFRDDPELRDSYKMALLVQQADNGERIAVATERMAGLKPGFDVAVYRKFLIEKECNALQLTVLHASDNDYDQKLVLWSIFVEPLVRESIPFVDTPPELLRTMRHEGHLPQTELEERFDQRRKRYQSAPIRNALEVLNRERLIVITGDPGSGKTSLLKYRALQWAKGDTGLPVPLLIYLREYARTDKKLLDYCQSGKELFCIGTDHVDRLLKSGGGALFLDGLDEVFDIKKRDSVIGEIIVLSALYPAAQIIVTSRKIGYDPDRLRTSGFLHATIEDFNESQIKTFLHLWHDMLDHVEDEEKRLQEARLERAISESQPIRELAGNPLLLTMMAILNRTRELPRARVTLYAEASRVLLEAWDTTRALPVGEFDQQDKEALLTDLAGEMQSNEGGIKGNLIERKALITLFESFLKGRTSDHQQKAKELVKQLTERNFILSFAGAGRFCFVHRTFLEYFCAVWFKERLQVTREITFEQMRDEVFGHHWRDEKWHEVLRLIAGMVSPRDAAALIEFLLEQNGVVHDYINLTLAVSCLNEVRDRASIEPVAQRLWRILTTHGIRLAGLGTYLDYFAVSAIHRNVLKLIAITWRDSGAFSWLVDRASNDIDDEIRSGALEELSSAWPNDRETVICHKNAARNDPDYRVRRAAIQGLARIAYADPETLSIIVDRVQNDKSEFVKEAGLYLLRQRWRSNPEALPLIRERDGKDRREITQDSTSGMPRGLRADLGSLPALKEQARNNPDAIVRKEAIELLALNWHADPEAVSIVKDRARNDKDYGVRFTALQTLELGWSNDPEIIDLLRDRFYIDDY